jgi:hypothetical protein
MRLPRFRLRTLMIAVAVAGIALDLHTRSCASRQLAVYHDKESLKLLPCGEHERLFDARRQRAWIWWHLDLAAKYRRAADHPWLPVPPDPPPPK